MAEIEIIHATDVKPRCLPGADEQGGFVRRIIFPPEVATHGVFMGISEVNPGYSLHRWHTHTYDKANGYEARFPENFDEVYFIIQGTGIVQWKTTDGRVAEKRVGPGDTVFMPAGVPEHQLLNDGSEKMVLLFCGSPFPILTLTEPRA